MNNIYRKSINPQGAYFFQTHLSGGRAYSV